MERGVQSSTDTEEEDDKKYKIKMSLNIKIGHGIKIYQRKFNKMISH